MKVMKFGGSSVANFEQMSKVFGIVKDTADKRLVVLSACQGVTDKLEIAATSAKSGDTTKTNDILSEITQHHQQIIKHCPSEAQPAVSKLISELTQLLEGITFLRELTPAAMDSVYSYGELLSTTIFYYLCQKNGLNAKWLDARNLLKTDSNFGEATALPDVYSQNLADTISNIQSDVIVTQGFIASNTQGKTTTLGRGGSDLTASLLGAAIKANEIQIWTDVDGVLSADPRKCSNTKSIEHLSFDEVKELSFWGAKVLHPKTIQPAMNNGIIVRVLNTNNPKALGTVISSDMSNTDFKINSIIGKQNCYMLRVKSDEITQDLTRYSDIILQINYSNGTAYLLLAEELTLPHSQLNTPVSAILLCGQNMLCSPNHLIKLYEHVSNSIGNIKVHQIYCNSHNSIVLIVDRCDIDEIIANIHKFMVK